MAELGAGRPAVRGRDGRRVEQLRLGEFTVERVLPGGDLGQYLVEAVIVLGFGTLGFGGLGFTAFYRGGPPFAAETRELAIDSRNGFGQAGAAHFLGGCRNGGLAHGIVARQAVDPPFQFIDLAADERGMIVGRGRRRAGTAQGVGAGRGRRTGLGGRGILVRRLDDERIPRNALRLRGRRLARRDERL